MIPLYSFFTKFKNKRRDRRIKIENVKDLNKRREMKNKQALPFLILTYIR